MGRLTEVRKAATPTGASRLTAFALKTKNPALQQRALQGVERNLASQTRARQVVRKSVGVGRKQKTDGLTSSACVVRTPTLRDINGKFAGEGQGVKVFHPTFSGSRRQPRGSKLQHWTKGGDSISKPWVSKADEPRKGMLGPVDLASMAPHTGARRGVRLVER